uniref:Uncharacterized protein n=1 Tax=Vespula pensylvanica TaxID=30213 RepID=A0A834K4A6_VESPE|nr:hypothetical protein H0235_015605 [Vespula pensylvanica]
MRCKDENSSIVEPNSRTRQRKEQQGGKEGSGEGSVAHGLDPWDWIHETGSAQRFRPAGMPKQEKDKEEEETKKRRGGGEEMVEEAGG